jgi:Ribulose bisphosphate carboxylase, small chain
MRVTQGCFSFLPDLNDEQVAAQIEYCLSQNWSVGVEYTRDPHPRNTYWDMWGNPMFDLKDAAGKPTPNITSASMHLILRADGKPLECRSLRRAQKWNLTLI